MRVYFWPLILIIKLIASKFPPLKKLLLLLGFFNPGPRGRSIVERHIKTFNNFYSSGLGFKSKISSICELGPGESNYSFIPATHHNIKNLDLIDVKKCRYKFERLSYNDLKSLNYKEIENIIYKTHKNTKENKFIYQDKGLNSLNFLKDNFYDFVFSNSVMQHISKREVNETINNLSRISKLNSIHIHYIDFRDCFSGKKNNLIFNDDIWESKIIYNSGFYTNRIQFSDFLDIFKVNGLKVLDIQIKRFKEMPISRDKIYRANKISNDDLIIKSAKITFTKTNIDN